MGAAGTVRELGQGRLMIDLGFRDTEGLIASYLIPGRDGDWTLVETGPSSCREALSEGVARAGVDPQEIRRAFVTHIHLDHAGGLGPVAGAFPRARLFAHRSGLPHLIDPTRLIASARRAWGAQADPLWGPITPVPPNRLEPLDGGETFPVLGGELHVLATPGHATHHLSFFDSARRSMMTGDSAGVLLEGADRSRPALPPPDLDLELLFQSLERMAKLHPQELWYAHFGPNPGGVGALESYRVTIEEWRQVALGAAMTEPEVGAVARALRQHEESRVVSGAGTPATGDRGEMISGYELAAMGLLRYFRTRGLLGERGG
ncbi:MAG: MBL fold metallo-hydrolase [Thermoplasmata archaeon]|nr:MBL fold metallo-hydrolase [Thermoplasmata archaeon]